MRLTQITLALLTRLLVTLVLVLLSRLGVGGVTTVLFPQLLARVSLQFCSFASPIRVHCRVRCVQRIAGRHLDPTSSRKIG